VESGNDLVLKASQKGITKNQVRQAVQMARELQFEVLTYYLIGFLDESVNEMQETYRFARGIASFFPIFPFQRPKPVC